MYLRGGSVGKLLATSAGGPEFDIQNLRKKTAGGGINMESRLQGFRHTMMSGVFRLAILV